MMSRSNSFLPFLWGVGTTLMVVWMVQINQKTRRRSKNENRADAAVTDDVDDNNDDPATSSTLVTPTTSQQQEQHHQQQQQQQPIWDAADLDQRMIRKAEAAIQLRCSRVTVVVERCTNDYNYSAILRTVEALGLQHVWIIEPPPPSYSNNSNNTVDDNNNDDNHNTENNDSNNNEEFRAPGTKNIIKAPTFVDVQDRALHHLFARKAMEWLAVREFDNTQDCLAELRRTNHAVWVTDLSQQAVCLTRDALQQYFQQQQESNNTMTSSLSPHPPSIIPQQLAIVFGTEAVGCSAEMLEAADLRVYLPLRGFADSLNLSVATALVLHQLFLLDPTLVGAMSEEERRHLRQDWFAKLCRQRLLTPGQKRQRHRLCIHIKNCQDMLRKQEQDGVVLQESQLEKLAQLPKFQQDLAALEQKNHLIEAAIADLVNHPPPPLTDMRRADEHRVCFVGKNTKRLHVTDWQDMPATRRINTLPNATASFFRRRIQEHDQDGSIESSVIPA